MSSGKMIDQAAQTSYTDMQSMTKLRAQARDNPKATLEKVAKHFESLYMKMMLDSMRQASFGDPYFDSNNSDMYRDLYDSQIALQLSEKQGLGLAEMLVKQLQNGLPNKEAGENDSAIPHVDSANEYQAKPQYTKEQVNFSSNEEFVETLMPYAEKAADEIGVAPQVLIAQAALETGWGKHVQQKPNGQSSYNLFNIKADSRWSGDRVNVQTIEYKDGIAQKEQASFRAYASYQESFSDYVDFIKSNPRYQAALESANDPHAYTNELQNAGYATDPNYAEKINNIFSRELVSAPYSDYLADDSV